VDEPTTQAARVIWEQLASMTQDDRDQWLESRELLVDGSWQQFVFADVQRHPGTPLFLFTDWPDGEHRVPMDTEIQVRQVRRG
jgi:hypothetical protein